MKKVSLATIKFAAEYRKMPFSAEEIEDPNWPTKLLAVLRVAREQLSEEFIEWDTAYRWDSGNFKLPDDKELLVLLLLTRGHLWTTIRSTEKEAFYRSQVGKNVGIIARR